MNYPTLHFTYLNKNEKIERVQNENLYLVTKI